ncbi:MAG: hypothetical protein IIW70_02590, partial [Bacteroidales bacterium]|nr:hypothetical protein [Bacteroidales bacterium]
SQKHLDQQYAITDIHKAKSPLQVYRNQAAPGAPKPPLTSICDPGDFAIVFRKLTMQSIKYREITAVHSFKFHNTLINITAQQLIKKTMLTCSTSN